MKNKQIQHQSAFTGVFLDYKAIFSQRNVWMFFAILWVFAYHSPIRLPEVLRFLQPLKSRGYGGVDIFLFASGIGCASSLHKNSALLPFYQRRARNIFPRYLVALAGWLIYCVYISDVTLAQAVANILGLGFVGGAANQFNWYICGMWICYLLAPLFWELAKAYPSVGKRLLIAGIMTGLSLGFLNNYQLTMWSRIPVFFLGVCAYETSTRRQGISLAEFMVSLVLMVIGICALEWGIDRYPDKSRDYGILTYPFILIAPGLCFLMSYLASLAEKTPLRPLVKLCSRGGRHTFGLYLAHIPMFEAYKYFRDVGAFAPTPITYLAAVAAILMATVLLELVDLWCKKWRKV